MIRLALVAALALAGSPVSAQDRADRGTPLFADDAMVELTLVGPIRTIARQAEKSTRPHSATIASGDEKHAITLAARGVSRRKKDNCRFPPLRIAFPDKPGEVSLFHKQDRIKLVTHCNDRDSAEQTMLREYAAYRLYNLVTPDSLKVRLARITYIEGEQLVTTRLGFLIEDADDAARRLGVKEVDITRIEEGQLDRHDAARYALFQYMIGNTDWSMTLGPDPAECCHNSKLLGVDARARTALTPLPYDFDNSGLVDAAYAVPNAILGTQSVKTRVYRGFCSFNDLVPGEAAKLRTLRPALEAELAATPRAKPKTVQAMNRYLAGFYRDIADDRVIEQQLLSKCR